MGRGAEQIQWPIHFEVYVHLGFLHDVLFWVFFTVILLCAGSSGNPQDFDIDIDLSVTLCTWYHCCHLRANHASFLFSLHATQKWTYKWGLQVSRVTVRAKEAVEAAGGSVRRVYYNKLGFRALLKPEWFEKKGRLLPKAARPPPKQKDKVDSIGRLPAPTKPIPFFTEEEVASSSSTWQKGSKISSF